MSSTDDKETTPKELSTQEKLKDYGHSYQQQEKKKSREKGIREKLIWYGSRTSCHGIPNITTSPRPFVKIMWFLFVAGSTTFCFFQVAKNINDYLNFEVDTVIVLVRDDEPEFPTMTFCNLQICGFKDYDFSSYLKKYKQDEQEKFGTNQDHVIDEKLRKNNTKTSFFSAKEVFLRKYDDRELTKILNKNKTSIGEMLLSCRLGDKPCNESDFEFFQMGEFQKCYKFNAKKNNSDGSVMRSKRYGKQNGFQMELYIGSEDDCKSPLSTTSGLVIYVHNASYTLTEEDNGIQIKPGTETDIATDRTYVKQLSEPYSKCFEAQGTVGSQHSQLVRRTVELAGLYTQQYCLQLCYQDFLIEFCNCYDQILPNFKPENLTACPKFIDSLYNCQYLIKRLFYNGKNDAHCLKDCPEECDFIKYDTTISYSKYPSNGYKELLDIYNDPEKLNGPLKEIVSKENTFTSESIISVNVFYSTPFYKKITEVPVITMSGLIPNIGGIVGLCLGMSVLSFVEIFELIAELFISFVSRQILRR